jgi:hypothetical protein
MDGRGHPWVARDRPRPPPPAALVVAGHPRLHLQQARQRAMQRLQLHDTHPQARIRCNSRPHGARAIACALARTHLAPASAPAAATASTTADATPRGAQRQCTLARFHEVQTSMHAAHATLKTKRGMTPIGSDPLALPGTRAAASAVSDAMINVINARRLTRRSTPTWRGCRSRILS